MGNFRRINKMKLLWKYLFAYIFVSNAFAVECVITAIKNSCWKDYEATITIRDVQTKKDLTTFKIPQNKDWGRTQFSCQPGQIFDAKASFSPDIWDGDGSKIYNSKRIWGLPTKAPNSDVRWSLNLCYSDDFTGMPEPIKSKNCVCDQSIAPPVEMKTTEIKN